MHANRRTNYSPMANAALNVLFSQSAEKSPAQEAYSNLFNKLCEEKGITHPFELDTPEATKAFFAELSERWQEQKGAAL